MTLSRCPLRIFCARGTQPTLRLSTAPTSDCNHKIKPNQIALLKFNQIAPFKSNQIAMLSCSVGCRLMLRQRLIPHPPPIATTSANQIKLNCSVELNCSLEFNCSGLKYSRLNCSVGCRLMLRQLDRAREDDTESIVSVRPLDSQNAFIDELQKVISPTKLSTSCFNQ